MVRKFEYWECDGGCDIKFHTKEGAEEHERYCTQYAEVISEREKELKP